MSDVKEQGDLFWMLTHQETQSRFLTRFFQFVLVRSFTADSNLLQPTVGVNRTPSHVTFSHLHALISMSHVTLVQGVMRTSRHVIMCLVVRLIWYFSNLYSVLSTVSLIFLFILLFFIFICHVGWFDEKSHRYFREWVVRHFGREQSSHKILRIQNLHQMEHCAFLEVIHLFQWVGCARNNLQFSHSSTESEIISLDAGLRLDGIPALDLWDLIVEVLHGNTYQSNQERSDPCSTSHISTTKTISRNDQWSGQCWFYFFKRQLFSSGSSVVVIKMVIKRRNPTMRHVFRIHRVALDWLFDRINLDSTIQIKYVDTKKQLTAILTKGNFTRDEWNHLLCSFNISRFSSTNCLEVMSKRTQEDAEKKESQQNRSRWWIWSLDAA